MFFFYLKNNLLVQSFKVDELKVFIEAFILSNILALAGFASN